MKGTRFLEILSVIRPNDYKQLGEFIKCGLFNKNRRITRAFEHLKTKKNLNELTKQELGHFAFGNEKFTDANFRMFISDFIKLLEKFLLLFNSTGYESLELISFFNRKGMIKSFEKHLFPLLKETKNKRAKDTFEYYTLYAIESELVLSDLSNDNLNGTEKKIDELIDLLYLSLKLDTAIHFAIAGREWKDESGLISEGYVRMSMNKEEHPFIYAKLLILRLAGGLHTKEALIELETFAELYKDELDFYRYITDALLWFYKKNGMKNEELKLLKELDKRDLILSNSTMKDLQLLNLIDASLLSGDLMSGVKFLEKYKPYCDSLSALELAYAKLELFKRNYEKTLVHLAKVSSNNPTYYLRVMEMKLIVYYGLGDKEQFAYTLDAFRHWLSRNKGESLQQCLAQYSSEAYRRFCNHISSLFVTRSQPQRMRLLHNKISEDILTSNKNWLLSESQ